MRRQRPGKPNGRGIGWRLIDTHYMYESHWHNLRQDRVQLPNGRETTYTYQEHPGFVTIVPLTTEREIVFIRHYRIPSMIGAGRCRPAGWGTDQANRWKTWRARS